MWQALGNLVEKGKKNKTALVNNVGRLIMENERLGPAQIASGSLACLKNEGRNTNKNSFRHFGQLVAFFTSKVFKIFPKASRCLLFFRLFFHDTLRRWLACIATQSAAHLTVSSSSFEWKSEMSILLKLIRKYLLIRSSRDKNLEEWQKSSSRVASFICLFVHELPTFAWTWRLCGRKIGIAVAHWQRLGLGARLSAGAWRSAAKCLNSWRASRRN